jgi:transcription elongation factor GreA
MSKIPMTVVGAEKLRQELHHLKTDARRKVTAAIAEARGHGDLRENAEYHAAKEQQAFIEGRVREIEQKLSNAHIIDLSTMQNNGKVVFGVTIKLINLDSDQQITYQIVGEDEANLKEGKISVNSPIARALIGKFQGDEVDVTAPGGVIPYEIAEVIYI